MGEPNAKRRWRREIARRRKKEQARAVITQTAQGKAVVRLSRRQIAGRDRILGWTLVTLAVVVGVSHGLQHVGAITILRPEARADLLIGYPTAGILGLLGIIVLGRRKEV